MWRTGRRNPGGRGPHFPLPAEPLWAGCRSGCGQRCGPQGQLGATLGTTHQATLPVPVGARRAGPLPVPMAPRWLQGLDSGLQEAVPQRWECQPAGDHRVAGQSLPGGRPHLTPSAPARLSQRRLCGQQQGRRGPALVSRGALCTVITAPPVPVTGAPGQCGHRALHPRAQPAAGPAQEPLAALRAPREEKPAQAPARGRRSVATPVLGLPEDDTGEASSLMPGTAGVVPGRGGPRWPGGGSRVSGALAGGGGRGKTGTRPSVWRSRVTACGAQTSGGLRLPGGTCLSTALTVGRSPGIF